MVMTVWRQDLLLHLPKIGEVTAPICDNFIKQVRIMERPLPATESGETRLWANLNTVKVLILGLRY